MHAFAPPEFKTTARTRQPLITSLLHKTGAATTWLVVKTADAHCEGPSLTIRVRSLAPELFKPAAVAEATNP